MRTAKRLGCSRAVDLNVDVFMSHDIYARPITFLLRRRLRGHRHVDLQARLDGNHKKLNRVALVGMATIHAAVSIGPEAQGSNT